MERVAACILSETPATILDRGNQEAVHRGGTVSIGMPSNRTRDFARHFVRVLFDGARDEEAVRQRLLHAYRPITPWLADVALHLLGRDDVPDAFDEAAWVGRVLADPRFEHAVSVRGLPRPVRWPLAERPSSPPRWVVAGLPSLESPSALARWLGLDPGELAWFADTWGQEARRADGALRHYRYRWHARDYGADRLIEMPKRRLRALQRRLHDELLVRVPVHEAAHGFVRERSVIGHARLHAGRAWVLRVDLERFFTGITAARVRGVFECLGYPLDVARLLAGLCTNRVPDDVLRSAPHGALPWTARQDFRQAHLPQGAPSSPVLANLVAWRLDARLAGWAARRGLAYSRYADDLTFSGDLPDRRAMATCARTVARIAEDSGFRVNHRKTCVFGAHQAQRVTGLVVNEAPNVARAEYDQLKAILTRCVRHGPCDENREGRADFRAWLRGRIGWCASVNPARGAKLEALYARIVWP